MPGAPDTTGASDEAAVPLTLGTAGHIDHGKTALITLLTGKNTDRLREEQERGISIELGYAELELPGGGRLSVVDVPGQFAQRAGQSVFLRAQRVQPLRQGPHLGHTLADHSRDLVHLRPVARRRRRQPRREGLYDQS